MEIPTDSEILKTRFGDAFDSFLFNKKLNHIKSKCGSVSDVLDPNKNIRLSEYEECSRNETKKLNESWKINWEFNKGLFFDCMNKNISVEVLSDNSIWKFLHTTCWNTTLPGNDYCMAILLQCYKNHIGS